MTGGAAGIGGGVSRRLAAAGATVVVNDIDPDLLAAAVADDRGRRRDRRRRAGRHPPTTTPWPPWLARPRSVADGRIDVLVNNVGDYRPNGRFLKTGPDDWNALYALNFEHVLRCTRAIAPAMVERGAGSIVNVSTVEAFRGIPANAVYSAFNAAVNAFTRSLAVELGRDGVRVNAIAPDLADTLQTPAASMLRGRDPEMVRHWVPLGRFGQPDDYGDVVVFLAIRHGALRHRPCHPRRRRDPGRQRLVPASRRTGLDQSPRRALSAARPRISGGAASRRRRGCRRRHGGSSR